MATEPELVGRIDGMARAYLQLVGVLLQQGLDGQLLAQRLNHHADVLAEDHPTRAATVAMLEHLAVQVEDAAELAAHR